MVRLIDAHVHFWDPAARHHDWLEQVPPLRRRFGPEDLDAGAREPSGIVFVQADCRDEEALDEVRWVARLTGGAAPIGGIVAYAPVHRGEGARPQLEQLAGEPQVVGVRRLLQGRRRAEIVEPELIAGIRLLADFGLTFDACVTHDQLPEVATLVRACPETTFVLDHLGKPPVAAGELDPWRANLERVAECSNTRCKLSGLTTEATPDWNEAAVLPFLEHALACFGPRRCMFGSDWPVSTLRTSYERWVDVVLEAIAKLPSEDRDAVLAQTAIRTYGLAEVPAGAAGARGG